MRKQLISYPKMLSQFKSEVAALAPAELGIRPIFRRSAIKQFLDCEGPSLRSWYYAAILGFIKHESMEKLLVGKVPALKQQVGKIKALEPQERKPLVKKILEILAMVMYRIVEDWRTPADPKESEAKDREAEP